ncbi:MAG: hypothetical protein KGO02_20990 [Alphaproteobacteria bacterium]|nr:hypothetical protein [Alphaproteobacteria bacterium]
MTRMTVDELLSARDTAGRRYAAAIAELRAAMVDLSAIEHALDHRDSGLDAMQRPVRTFTGEADAIPASLLHPIYAPEADGGINYEATIARDGYLTRLAGN